MTETNSSELRLQILDIITSTVANFTNQEGQDTGERVENMRAIEDTSEYMVDLLGLQIMDGVDLEGRITAVMPRDAD
jgi:hypothetical protein